MEYLVSISFSSSPLVNTKTMVKGFTFQDPIWYMGRVQSCYFVYSFLTKHTANLRLYFEDLMVSEICNGDIQCNLTLSYITPQNNQSILFESDYSEEELLQALEDECNLYYSTNQNHIPTLDAECEEHNITVPILKGSTYLLDYTNGKAIDAFW
ncbi:hypothetical protein NC796_04740 [Aliifodinibius sp. S!AR15-10]|uniref:hypothetical protein n=1 Tax=Aliifodinibius sp. S!AR15-10 TaxID=2950437 RepID=UPI00285B211B|nr:hypothetical protein [Aliifodinibius sp. S!AR15-10]MDR8390438.1 hypothetical protein [Aliifodinibius sp. S!AR15-10]